MNRVAMMLILVLASAVCAQWEIQAPRPTTENLSPVCFLNSSLGFVGGDSGLMLRTTDGGETWTEVSPSHVSRWINSIYFTDLSNGWACGDNSCLIHTTDSGLTWQDVHPGFPFSANVISFPTRTEGWMFGYPVLHTTDGGVTWDTTDVFSGSRSYERGFFVDSLNGWAAQRYPRNLLHTTDGGASWTSRATDSLQTIQSLWFVSADEGWMATNESDEDTYSVSRILHTTNAGESWVLQNADSTTYWYSAITFQDALHGCVTGSNDVMKTTDGGQTWTHIHVPGADYMYGISVAGPGSYVATGYRSVIVRSFDNGATWHHLSSGVAGVGWSIIEMADAGHGWVGGWWNNLLSTTDGGTHWELSSLAPEVERVNDILSLDSLHVFVGVSETDGAGNLLRSTDGGLTWNAQLPASAGPVTGLYFLNARLGWAVERDSIYRSTDSGQSWSAQASSDVCSKVFFVDSLFGWACGLPQWIIHTEDGGTTWTRQWTSAGYGITDPVFCNRSEGWVRLTGYHGAMMHTSDGGANWEWSHLTGWPELLTLAYADSQHGFLISFDDAGEWIWRNTDCGDSWVQDETPLPVHEGVTDMDLISPQEGWVIDGQYILHYRSPLAAEPARPPVPESFSLSAFPNPFNPTTVISFDIPKSSRVSLSIFDLTGRLVQTLADQVYAQGNYRIEFDGASLPSGIYFARLQGSTFSKTQKLVLLK